MVGYFILMLLSLMVAGSVLAFALAVITQRRTLGAGVGVFIKTEYARIDKKYQIFVDRVLPDTPATNLLRQGDRLVAVDGVELVGSSKQQARKLSKKILGSEGSKVQLAINRCGAEFGVEITRARLKF